MSAPTTELLEFARRKNARKCAVVIVQAMVLSDKTFAEIGRIIDLSEAEVQGLVVALANGHSDVSIDTISDVMLACGGEINVFVVPCDPPARLSALEVASV